MGLVQKTADDLPTQWVSRNRVRDVLRYLKLEAELPYRMLYDLTAIDERTRAHRNDQPPSRFTVIYHLLSFERNADVRLKVALTETYLHMPTITDIWPAANWYEREIWDLFGMFSTAIHIWAGCYPRGGRVIPCARNIPRAQPKSNRSICREKQEAEQETCVSSRRMGNAPRTRRHGLHVPEPRT